MFLRRHLLEILLGTCASLTSRGSLFVVILLVLSDPTNSGVRLCFRLRCLASSLIARVTSCVGPVLTSLVTSPVKVFWSVLAAKVRPSLLCSPSQLRLVYEAPSQQVSPFRIECRTRGHCRLETTGPLAFRVFDPRPHLADSGILLTFAARVLIADPCSVTITASDDELMGDGDFRGPATPPACINKLECGRGRL